MMKSGRFFLTQAFSHASRFKWDGENGYKGSDAVVVLQAPRAGSYNDRVWRVKAGKVTPPPALDAKADEVLPMSAQIVVLTAKDAEIILNKKKSEGAKSEKSPGVK